MIARIPFDIAKTWPARRGLRVRGEIEGFGFRTSLFPDPRGDGHFLLVNKKMQAAAKAAVGAQVRIALAPDLEERPTQFSPELAKALKGDRRLRPWFDKLSPSMRREIDKFVSEPKTAGTRELRAQAMAERPVAHPGGRKGAAPHSACGLPAPAAGAQGMEGHDADAEAQSSAGDFLLSERRSAESAAPPKRWKRPCGWQKNAHLPPNDLIYASISSIGCDLAGACVV